MAEAIEPYEPGKRTAQWRNYLSEMRLSSALLAQATRENDRSSMLVGGPAAQCRLSGLPRSVLRDGPRIGGGHGFFCSPVKSSPQPGVQSGFFGLIFRETSLSGSHRFVPESIGAMEFALLKPRR